MSHPKSSAQADQIDFGKSPFEFKEEAGFGLLVFNGLLDADIAKEFEKRLKAKIDGFSSDIAIDLNGCEEIHPAWSRVFMHLVAVTKQNGKKVRVITANDRHRLFLQEQGLTGSLPVVQTIQDASREFAAKKSNKVDVNLINPFLEGTLEVLRIQAKTNAKASAPVMKDPKSSFGGDISGVIGLTSPSFNGTVVISFPAQTFLNIMSRMLGEEFTEITPDIQDGASELTNIIFGHAKRVLNERGYGIQMAIPSVITGKNHSIQNNSSGPRIAVPFESDAGSFGIEICVADS
jgi:chemotaxis protein CheX